MKHHRRELESSQTFGDSILVKGRSVGLSGGQTHLPTFVDVDIYVGRGSMQHLPASADREVQRACISDRYPRLRLLTSSYRSDW